MRAGVFISTIAVSTSRIPSAVDGENESPNTTIPVTVPTSGSAVARTAARPAGIPFRPEV